MKKRWITLGAIAVLLLVLLAGYLVRRQSAYSHTFFALDTVVQLRLYGSGAKEAAAAAEAEVRRLEGLLSAANAASDIYRINSSAMGEPVKVSQETAEVLTLALDVSKKTNGCFDPTIAPLTNLWDIKNATAPPAQGEIERAMDCLGAANIEITGESVTRLSDAVQLDLGGIAKGYIGDQAAQVVRGYECRGILDLGGNIVAVGMKKQDTPWKVGIKDPVQADRIVETVEVSDESVVTSGGYERYFEYEGRRYHHILNPFTGYPAESGLASVTVISPDGALADALSTAIFVAGPEEGKRIADQFGVEVVLVDESGAVLR